MCVNQPEWSQRKQQQDERRTKEKKMCDRNWSENKSEEIRAHTICLHPETVLAFRLGILNVFIRHRERNILITVEVQEGKKNALFMNILRFIVHYTASSPEWLSDSNLSHKIRMLAVVNDERRRKRRQRRRLFVVLFLIFALSLDYTYIYIYFLLFLLVHFIIVYVFRSVIPMWKP